MNSIVSKQNFVNILVNVGPNEFFFGYALSRVTPSEQGTTLDTYPALWVYPIDLNLTHSQVENGERKQGI